MRWMLFSLAGLAVAGCVSDQEIQARVARDQAQAREKAACTRSGASHLSIAKCENAVAFAYAGPNLGRDRDIYVLAAATRENIAARVDRREITEDQANLEIAQAYNSLTAQTQQRDSAAVRDRATIVQAEAASRPVEVNVRSCGRYSAGIYVNTAC